MLKNLDSTIEKLVVQRITRLVSGKFTYSPDGTLNGKSLEAFIREATNDIIEDVIEKNIKEIFAKNLKYYLNYYQTDRNKICNDLEIPASTFSDWLNAKKYPRIDKIELLANYFNIKKSDLIEDKYKNQNPDELDVLFDKHKDILTDDDKETIKFIIEKRKREIDKELDGE